MTTRTNKNLPFLLLSVFLAGVALLALSGCSDDSDDSAATGKTSAYRATSWYEMIGGPDAYGMPGDFIMENSKIRVLVQDQGDGRGVGLFGGGILDADRVRTLHDSCCGNGNDLFQLLTPFVNMMIPAVKEGEPSPVAVKVVQDGSDGNEARIRVEGHAAPLLSLLGTEVNDILAQAEYDFQVDYILYPDVDYVKIRTTIGVNQMPGSSEPFSTESLTSKESVLVGLLNGNLLLGDALFLGSSVTAFGPPFGFYLDGILWEMFMQDPPSSSLSDPIVTDYIAGVGDGMSYGMATREGNLQLPLFSSSISVMVSSKFVQDDHPLCERNALSIYFDNYFIVGEGDAASVLDTIYQIRGTSTGTLSGNVVDAGSMMGLSHKDVFVFKDPGKPKPGTEECVPPYPEPDPTHHWPELNANWYSKTANPCQEGHQEVTLDNLLFAMSQSNTKGDKKRISPLLTQVETDRFEDLTPDGSFHCQLEPGPYILVPHSPEHPEGNLTYVTVRPGEESRGVLALRASGNVYYEIRDQTGKHIPGKITFRGQPIDPDSDACKQNLLSVECERYGDRRPFLGDGYKPNRVSKVDFTHTGTGTVTLRPGTYDWWITRGPEYTVEKGEVQVVARQQAEVRGWIEHVVDTRGYMSFDIHQHAQRSFDSGVPNMERLKTNVAEQVEIMNATDHNYVMNFWPLIEEMGIEAHLNTVISNELTTFESGHYIAFPQKWDPWQACNGAPPWQGKTMPQIFDTLRDESGFGRGNTVVHVPHPRDSLFGLLYLFSLDPSTPKPDWASLFDISPDILSTLNPVINPVCGSDPLSFILCNPTPETVQEYFSLDFESMELLNAKRFELIRTPTVSEYENICQMSDMNPAGGFSDERDCLLKGKATVYDVMKRTFPEQQAIFDGTDPLSGDFKQILEDWFAYLNLGNNITATGGSDTHSRIRTEAGCPRTYLRYSSDSPVNATDSETAQRVFDHQATMSYGPFLDFSVNGDVLVGDTTVDTDGEVTLRIRVQTPGWFNVDRIEIYGNGFLVGDIGEDATPWDGVDANQPMPGPHPVRCVTAGMEIKKNTVMAFDEEITCKLPPDPADPGRFQDMWFAVIAMGDSTMTESLFPLYTNNDYPYIQIGGMIFLALASLGDIQDPIDNPGPLVEAILNAILPFLSDIGGGVNAYTIFPIRPWASTNPIWVDANGGGFEPSREIVVNYGASKASNERDPQLIEQLNNPNYLKFLRTLLMTKHHAPPPRYGPLPRELTAQKE